MNTGRKAERQAEGGGERRAGRKAEKQTETNRTISSRKTSRA